MKKKLENEAESTFKKSVADFQEYYNKIAGDGSVLYDSAMASNFEKEVIMLFYSSFPNLENFGLLDKLPTFPPLFFKSGIIRTGFGRKDSLFFFHPFANTAYKYK